MKFIKEHINELFSLEFSKTYTLKQIHKYVSEKAGNFKISLENTIFTLYDMITIDEYPIEYTDGYFTIKRPGKNLFEKLFLPSY